MNNTEAATWVQAAAAVGQLIALVWYTIVTVRILKETRQSASATSRAADITARTFEATNRPYVVIRGPELVGPRHASLGELPPGHVKFHIENISDVLAEVTEIRLEVLKDGNRSNAPALQSVLALLPHAQLSPSLPMDANDWFAATQGQVTVSASLAVAYRSPAGKSYRSYIAADYRQDSEGFVATETQAS